MLQSMTAYASGSGTTRHAAWTIELRGVNGRGLELRLRLPDSLMSREHALRSQLTSRLARGNVTLTIRLTRQDGATDLQLDKNQLDAVLLAFERIQARALDLGVTLAHPTASDVMTQRGVISAGSDSPQGGDPDIAAAVMADVHTAIDAFCQMRAHEGAALTTLLHSQLDDIAALLDKAAIAAEARRPQVASLLEVALARIGQDITEVDPARLTQELAILATKSDVTEELDRLRTHVAAARDLIASAGPHGRKLDFLSQEFNREANTLCSKSQDVDLTAVGLALKAVIDQMREQIQNVE